MSVVAIVENYREYRPPFDDVSEIVRELLDALPAAYRRGISAVVLTNHAALSTLERRHGVRFRGGKVEAAPRPGRYREATRGEPAWIRLMVDRILSPTYGAALKLRPVRAMVLAATLYHEVGHHLHRTTFPDVRPAETVADAWSWKLRRRYWKRRYWYLPLFVAGLTTRAIVRAGRFARRWKAGDGTFVGASSEPRRGPAAPTAERH